MSERIGCRVLASDKQREMYLFLTRDKAFEDLPEALRRHFGGPRPIMELELHSARRLARVQVGEVMAALQTQGFFLQMPPQIEAELYQAES